MNAPKLPEQLTRAELPDDGAFVVGGPSLLIREYTTIQYDTNAHVLDLMLQLQVAEQRAAAERAAADGRSVLRAFSVGVIRTKLGAAKRSAFKREGLFACPRIPTVTPIADLPHARTIDLKNVL
jgi:hypothetical protein